MTEVLPQGWEEPETIQRWVVLPFPIERAVAEFAQQQDATSLEVIAQLLQESLEQHGYSFNGNGNGHEAASASSATATSSHDLDAAG